MLQRILISNCVKVRKIIQTGLFLICILLHSFATGQGLSVTRPLAVFKEATTDSEPALISFGSNCFIAWKQAGAEGDIWLGKLNNQPGGIVANAAAILIPGAYSDFAPGYVSFNGLAYVFWINKAGRIQYIAHQKDALPATFTINELPLTGTEKLSQGISMASMGDQLLLATHGDKKDELLYAVLQLNDNGGFKETAPQKIQQAKSKNYPHVAALNNTTARFCWNGKSDLIYYADFDLAASHWSAAQTSGNSVTSVSPAIYQPRNEQALLYIWKGNRKDTRMYYKLVEQSEKPAVQNELPVYFSSRFSAAVTQLDNNHLVLAYTGLDGQLMVSSLINYQPARWMEIMIGPATSNKTLKDIVMPGAHDAGMSILTATGGQQKGTINDCNTLTQKLNIEQQLNSGIRMFDFRAGTYNKMLYTKHASSDCMEDALGGGYGEKLHTVALAIKHFLQTNQQEIILTTFSHFCEKETPLETLKDSLVLWIGPDLIYTADVSSFDQVPLSKLAGKVVLSFEVPENADKRFPTCSIADQSSSFINFRRAYAATNNLSNLLDKEKAFFTALSSNSALGPNDMVRLDWQLTQSNDEAPVICNDFEDDKINPIVNGVLLLTNVIRKNKSIINHAIGANAVLPVKLNEWIKEGIINKQNKPHILYVDVAGTWITDYCINLLRSELYN
ncbi:MAG TPA: hypothetical protein VJ552_08575 [Sediminibacterium sp.]|nr:hypothetical protein [Sediminibacterium sp.]